MLSITGYTLQKILHSSTHTDIYKGIRSEDKQKVILKLPHGDNPPTQRLATLQHEYHLLQQLHDVQGVVQLYDIVKTHYLPILILEDIGGISLKEYLTTNVLTIEKFLDIAFQIAQAVGELHQHHIIHKDIKPANIIIDPVTQKIKLTDLSISSQLSEQEQEYISINELQGSLPYLSPEQTGRMNRPIDYRADFYSMGITYFEMLTGKLPFQSNDILDLVHAHLAINPPLVSDLNPEVPEMVAKIINKLLNKMPEGRYSSSIGIKHDLQECITQWKKNKKIIEFDLGKYDVNEHLYISRKLYGREKQIQQILDAFERTSQGETEIVFISGYAGIGKTSLVKEVYKPMVQKKGYFLQGKFDQLARNKPYSAIAEAFKGLIKQILSEPEEKFNLIKQELKQKLGQIGQVIIEVIPEVEQLIGLQPPIPTLSSKEAENRFILVFQNFVQVFAKKEHPLVLFLDDLQWADSSSLKLMGDWIYNLKSGYILLIGAFRSNEIGQDHMLYSMRTNLEKSSIKLTSIELQPLKPIDVQQLLMDTLNLKPQESQELTNIVVEKTHGNPFFVNEFLKKTYSDHHLYFSYKDAKWIWDIDKIIQQKHTDNVVDFLTEKLHQLSPDIQKILKLSACIGFTFDLKTVAIISQKNSSTTAKLFWEAILSNLIRPIGENYKIAYLLDENNDIISTKEKISYQFVHDKIQQATYELILPEERQKIHLEIGKLLLSKKHLKKTDQNLMTIVNHFNQAKDLIIDDSEKVKLAKYNLWAGQRAMSSLAYNIAQEFFQHGIDFSGNLSHKNLFQLYRDNTACLYTLGKIDEGEACFQKAMKMTDDKFKKADLHQIKIDAYTTNNKHLDALEVAKESLKLFEFYYPKRITRITILKAMAMIHYEIGTRKISDLKKQMSPVHSEEIKKILEILAQIITSSYFSNQEMCIYSLLRQIRINIKHGYTDTTSYALYVYANVLNAYFGLYKLAFEFVDLAKAIEHKNPDSTELYKSLTGYGYFLNHWKNPLSESQIYMEKAYQQSIEVGSTEFAIYGKMIDHLNYFLGKNLNELSKDLDISIEFLHRSKNKVSIHSFILIKKIVQSLLGEKIRAQEFHNLIELHTQCNQSLQSKGFMFYAQYLYHIYQEEKALKYMLHSFRLKKYLTGTFDVIFIYVFYVLIVAKNYHRFNFKERFVFSNRIRKIRKLMLIWAKRCPENYTFMYHLTAAEYARIHGHSNLVQYHYDKSIDAAQKYEFPSFVAIIAENAGSFYMDQKKPFIAAAYLHKAYNVYDRWGAKYKCALMRQEYATIFSNFMSSKESDSINENPFALTADSTSTNSHMVDMLAILKSTQIISSEIELDKLLKNLLKIVLQDAGAERAMILAEKKKRWYVEAEGDLKQQHFYLVQPEYLEDRNDIPLTLIQYVQRTKESVIISEATTDKISLNDLYVKKMKPQSLFIMPIIYQGHLSRILYLEHHHNTHAFTKNHLQSLQLLMSQAVISLENAHLYYQATHDPLTGLANRNLLYHTFQQKSKALNSEQKQIALAFLDLDYFKTVNDTLGHEVGDKLLQHMAFVLQSCIRDRDLAVRLGGDEFVIMLEGIEDDSQVKAIVNRIYQKLKNPVMIQNHELRISSSMGISSFPRDGNDIETILKCADTALYQSKEKGRNQYNFYSHMLEEEAKSSHAMEISVQQAIEQHEFTIYYQPIFKVNHEGIVGINNLEALLRWQHPEKGILEAKDFIPLIEKSNFLINIGQWITLHICKQAKQWVDQKILMVPITINISAAQFKKQSISQLFSQALAETHIDPKFLQIEITETMFVDRSQYILNEITAIKELGIALVMDDFGTGYSSLNYLKRLPINQLKIDQSFVKEIANDKHDAAIVEAVIAMAHKLDIKVIAEGVEKQEQLNYLVQSGVDAVQGYYFGYPLNASQCEQFLENTFIHKENVAIKQAK